MSQIDFLCNKNEISKIFLPYSLHNGWVVAKFVHSKINDSLRVLMKPALSVSQSVYHFKWRSQILEKNILALKWPKLVEIGPKTRFLAIFWRMHHYLVQFWCLFDHGQATPWKSKFWEEPSKIKFGYSRGVLC